MRTQANINKNKGELAVPQYKDIDEAYKSKRVELITTELANHDLDKYYKALDQTLMKFHNDKMQEINKIVKELWQQTYQGQDIDTIQVRLGPVRQMRAHFAAVE
jgi:DNA repair protein RAD50